jgi:hypothetical protein
MIATLTIVILILQSNHLTRVLFLKFMISENKKKMQKIPKILSVENKEISQFFLKKKTQFIRKKNLYT